MSRGGMQSPLKIAKIEVTSSPTEASHAVRKDYVDALVNNLDWKASVRVATTGNGTLASAFDNGSSVDGVTLATGNRILIKNQGTGSENGIYTVNASGAPTRATDFDADAEVTGGALVAVEEGTANADKTFQLTTNNPITVGSTSLVFAEFGGTQSASDISWTNPVTSTVHLKKDATTATTHLEMLRLELSDEGVDMNIGHGPGIDFYVGETSGSNYGGSVAVVREVAGDADSAAGMAFHTAADDQTPAAAREKMRITSAGNVGINVTDPDTTLEVQGIISGRDNFYSITSGSGNIDHTAINRSTNIYIRRTLGTGDQIRIPQPTAANGGMILTYHFASAATSGGDSVVMLQNSESAAFEGITTLQSTGAKMDTASTAAVDGVKCLVFDSDAADRAGGARGTVLEIHYHGDTGRVWFVCKGQTTAATPALSTGHYNTTGWS